MPEPTIRVLESFQAPRKTTNPYITMLFNALGQTCEVQAFTWKEALRGRIRTPTGADQEQAHRRRADHAQPQTSRDTFANRCLVVEQTRPTHNSLDPPESHD